MVKNITRTSQYDIFDTLKSVLKTNSILSRKFRDSDYYEYEPNIQSLSFKQLPYIAMVGIFNDTDTFVINSKTNLKDFSINFVLVVDYQARDKIRDYINAIVSQIESSQSSFESQGYYDISVDVVDRVPEFVNNKQVITVTFELLYKGMVDR